jgi:hypothetical protein
LRKIADFLCSTVYEQSRNVAALFAADATVQEVQVVAPVADVKRDAPAP